MYTRLLAFSLWLQHIFCSRYNFYFSERSRVKSEVLKYIHCIFKNMSKCCSTASLITSIAVSAFIKTLEHLSKTNQH